MGDIEVKPEHRRRAYFFKHLNRDMPADFVEWVDTGCEPDEPRFGEYARLASLIAFAEARGAKREREVCASLVEFFAAQMAATKHFDQCCYSAQGLSDDIVSDLRDMARGMMAGEHMKEKSDGE